MAMRECKNTIFSLARENQVIIKKTANSLRISGEQLTLCRGDRTRTCDILVPNQERYQLRYTSILRVQR